MIMTKINSIKENQQSFKGLSIGPHLCDALTVLSKASTATQRGVIGTTAAFLQPNIDLRNKNVDEETRTLNASRSIARAIVGTATGIAIRCGFIGLAKNMVKEAPKNALQRFFTTESLEAAREAAKGLSADSPIAKDFARRIGGYGEVFGTALALGVMLFTNFLVDVPLTHKLSMWINKTFFKKENVQQAEPKTEEVEK